MKIIHCADIHADSKMGSHFTKEQAETRREEIIDSFDRMVSYAKNNNVQVILIAGDLFDTKESQQKRLKQRIAHIIEQAPAIDFLYLRGNHDEDVNFLTAQELQNFKTFNKNEWTKYSYENVDIFGHEFGKSIPISSYSELNVDPTHINIVALHGQIASYRTKDGAPEISLPNLSNKNIDYIALGHIHDYKMEQLDKRCVWCYSGCLEGRGFDECGEKGFIVLEIDGKKINKTFVSVSKRKINEISVELEGEAKYSDILTAIDKSTLNIKAEDIVQIDLVGEVSEETEIEVDALQRAFASKFFYIRIKDKTETKIDYSKYENDVSLKGEFIRIVKSQENLSDEEKAKIIATGIKALSGGLN